MVIEGVTITGVGDKIGKATLENIGDIDGDMVTLSDVTIDFSVTKDVTLGFGDILEVSVVEDEI